MPALLHQWPSAVTPLAFALKFVISINLESEGFKLRIILLSVSSAVWIGWRLG